MRRAERGSPLQLDVWTVCKSSTRSRSLFRRYRKRAWGGGSGVEGQTQQPNIKCATRTRAVASAPGALNLGTPARPHPRRTETPIPTADGASCGSQARRRAPGTDQLELVHIGSRTSLTLPMARISRSVPLNVALRATGSGIEPTHAARAMQMTCAPSPSEVCARAGQFCPTVATATSFQPSSAPSTW